MARPFGHAESSHSEFLKVASGPTTMTAMKPPRSQPALIFRLIIPVTVVFIMTILALIASLFGNPNAPVSKWLDANGNTLLIWEFVAVIVLSFLAMTVDRVRTLQGHNEAPHPASSSPLTAADDESVSNNSPLQGKTE
ncbi:MAG: hypothetical protein R3C49_27640 [Planctomycetaceae bacterium]